MSTAPTGNYDLLLHCCIPTAVRLRIFRVGYMQMTAAQTETWSADANQYLADEDEDMFTARVSGQVLLEELLSKCGPAALAGLSSGLHRRLQDAAGAKVTDLLGRRSPVAVLLLWKRPIKASEHGFSCRGRASAGFSTLLEAGQSL